MRASWEPIRIDHRTVDSTSDYQPVLAAIADWLRQPPATTLASGEVRSSEPDILGQS